MQNSNGTIDAQSGPTIRQSDKLMFCLFLAIAFHALLLFGVGFKIPDLTKSPFQKTFKVELARYETDTKPEKADFIGQANQEGGGESEQAVAPSARKKAQFNDPNFTPTEQQQSQVVAISHKIQSEIITGNGRLTKTEVPNENPTDESLIPDTASLINKSYQLSGLIANLNNKDINQARMGRKRQVSASIHRASDALYLDSWRKKIEYIGNLNYPEKAKAEQIYGNVTMKVAINKNGTINNVSIMQSSGSKVLDRAAISIVRLAAPFNPLTKEMTKDTDILEIVRVWQFQPDYWLKTQ